MHIYIHMYTYIYICIHIFTHISYVEVSKNMGLPKSCVSAGGGDRLPEEMVILQPRGEAVKRADFHGDLMGKP